jgi:hypothetical protein
MRCHDHAAEHPLGSHRDLWAVVEAADHLAFGTLLELIGWEVQTRLDPWMIESGVLFATGHKSETGQIGEHGPGAILSIEAEEGTFLRELVCSQIPINGRETLTQFLSIATVPFVAKRTEPVETVGLTDDRAGTHNLPALAAPVASSTDVIQPAKRWGQVFGLG